MLYYFTCMFILFSVVRYMKIRKVAASLEDKVLSWFDYVWTNRQGLDDDDMLISLPEKLRLVSKHACISRGQLWSYNTLLSYTLPRPSPAKLHYNLHIYALSTYALPNYSQPSYLKPLHDKHV